MEDTGPGIPQGDRERVRQRFYRLPNSPGHGSGLGLAIVDEIAGLYGATLSIGSGRSGAGTKVMVQFPVRRRLTYVAPYLQMASHFASSVKNGRHLRDDY